MTKATAMPGNADDFQGEAASHDPEAAKLAEQHRKENERKQQKAERRSNVSDELYKRHKKIIASKLKELGKAQDIVTSLNGQLRELYATAKDDGINTKAMKEFFKLEATDPDELQETMRDVARIARVTNSPLVQLKLFDEGLNDEKGDITPYARGFDAGKSGAGKDTNNFTAGTEDFERWNDGWNDGQAELVREKLGPKKPRGNGKNKLN